MSPDEISAANTTLPEPVPDRSTDVVVFDGRCSFCTRQVQRIARCDGGERISFLSLHDPRVAERYPDLTHEELMARMYVIDKGGGRHGGAGAFRYLSRRLPRLWPLAPLMHLPFSLPLWQWIYNIIARHRYWLGTTEVCEDNACSVHMKK